MNTATRKSVSTIVAVAIGVIGIAVSGVAFSWVAGSLAISAAAASQIVTAVEVGGAALVVVGVIFGAGIVGAVIATIRYMIVSTARNLVVA
jgi:asparagine N-glycosylation enzyme membrane subunit Stt3